MDTGSIRTVGQPPRHPPCVMPSTSFSVSKEKRLCLRPGSVRPVALERTWGKGGRGQVGKGATGGCDLLAMVNVSSCAVA